MVPESPNGETVPHGAESPTPRDVIVNYLSQQCWDDEGIYDHADAIIKRLDSAGYAIERHS